MAKKYVFMSDEELENKGIELDYSDISDIYYMICRGDLNGKVVPEMRDGITDFIESVDSGCLLVDIESALKEKGLIVEE